MSAFLTGKAFVVLSAAFAAAFLTACDGHIQVRGRVYAQRQPGAQSRAFVDQTPDDDLSGLVQLEGAKLNLYHAHDYDKEPIDPSAALKASAESKASGEFDLNDVTAPYKSHPALVVEKPGYKPVTKIFEHDGRNHTAVIILAPEPTPDDKKH